MWSQMVPIVALVLIALSNGQQIITSAFQGSWTTTVDGSLPSNTFIGGNEGADTLYICRTNSLPGWMHAGRKVCRVTPNSIRHDQSKYFEVLTNFQGVWTPVFAKTYPVNTFVVSQYTSGKPIYVGRIKVPGFNDVVPGEVANDVLTVSSNKIWTFTADYEVLTSVPFHKVAGILGSNPKNKFVGNYTTFRVKVDPTVQISLVFEGGAVPIVLTYNDKKLPLLTENAMIYTANMASYVSDKKYTGFWLHRNGATMNLGVEGVLAPKFTFTFADVANVNQITFTSDGKSYWYLPNDS